MVILCRTGCGEEISYEEFEFEDGYVYYLPRNLDGSIHNCENLPEDGNYGEYSSHEKTCPVDERIGTEFTEKMFELRDKGNMAIAETENPDFVRDREPTKKEIQDNRKKRLLKMQICCVLYPAPFLKWDYTALQIDYAPSESWKFSDLVTLAECYSILGMTQCEKTALLIQNIVTGGQSSKILELEKKSTDFVMENEEIKSIESLSVNHLQQKLRELEKGIKDFLRKQFKSTADFKTDFPEIFSEAKRKQSNDNEIIKKNNQDIFEFMTFGEALKVIRYKKTESRKNQSRTRQMSATIWDKFGFDEINRLSSCVHVRNQIAHYSDVDIESSFNNDEKIIHFLYCKQLIGFFKDLENI